MSYEQTSSSGSYLLCPGRRYRTHWSSIVVDEDHNATRRPTCMYARKTNGRRRRRDDVKNKRRKKTPRCTRTLLDGMPCRKFFPIVPTILVRLKIHVIWAALKYAKHLIMRAIHSNHPQRFTRRIGNNHFQYTWRSTHNNIPFEYNIQVGIVDAQL